MKDQGGILLLLGIGGLVWYMSSQSSAAAPTSTAGAGTAGNTPPPGATSTATAPSAGPASAATPAAAYSGPSLAAMYSALIAAVVAGYNGGDPAVTCGSGLSGLGIPRPGNLAPAPVVTRTVRPVAPTAGGTPVTAATRVGSNRSGCIDPHASPDVWNWYLSQRANVGVTNPPTSAAMGLNENTPIDGPTYWAAAAPLLQVNMPGLSGFGGLQLRRPALARAKAPRSYYYGGMSA